MSPEPLPALVVFDLDRTLTSRDTSLPFLSFAVGRVRLLGALTRRSPLLLLDLAAAARLEAAGAGTALGGLRGRWVTVVHQRLVRATLRGRTREELRELGLRFAREVMDGIVSPEGLAQVAWHRERGDACVLATASLDLYAEPWGLGAGFDQVLATRVAFDSSGRATGDFEGEPCWGEAKLRRLHREAGPIEGRPLVVYGDSPGDRALLRAADRPVLVRGPETWRRIAAARG